MSESQNARSRQNDKQKSHDTYHAHDHGADQHQKATKDKHPMTQATPTNFQPVEHEHTHTADGIERGEQKVTVEDSGPARKKLTIEVPADRIEKKIAEAFGKLQSDSVLPGFRRGRAPQRLLHKRFGDAIRQDVKSQLLSETYTQAVEDENLDVIGEPEVKDLNEIKLPESGPLVYSVEVEVSPVVELPALEGLAVSKVRFEVTETDVDEEVKALGLRQAKSQTLTEGEVKEDDFINASVTVLAGENAGDGAETLAFHPEAYILVNGAKRDYKGHVIGIVVDDLGKQLTGKKPGDVITISMTGPAVHELDKIKGKPITLKITVNKIERREPAPVEEVVKGVGLESAQQLRDRLKEMLQARKEREQQSKMHEEIADVLLSKVTLALPEGLTGRQSSRLLRRRALELAYRGVAELEIEAKLAEMRQASEEDARKQLKLFFILDQAAKTLNIDVDEEEVNGRIAMLAAQQGRRPEKLRQQMVRSGEVEHLFLQIREQKTLDAIIAKATVSEVDAPAKA